MRGLICVAIAVTGFKLKCGKINENAKISIENLNKREKMRLKKCLYKFYIGWSTDGFHSSLNELMQDGRNDINYTL